MEILRATKIMRIGTSLGIVIPSNVLKGMGWQRGDQVIFTFSDNDYLLVKRPSDIELREFRKATKDGDIVIGRDGNTKILPNV